MLLQINRDHRECINDVVAELPGSTGISQDMAAIIPAGGAAVRLGSPSQPKELIPTLIRTQPNSVLKLTTPLEYSLNAIASARITRCMIVTTCGKADLSSRIIGAEARVTVAAVYEQAPRGLASAVNAALSWMPTANVAMVLPDTIFYPSSALEDVRRKLETTNADLVLGVFPTDNPYSQAPVLFQGDSIIEIFEKPAVSNRVPANTWGIAAWRPSFSQVLHGFVETEELYKQRPSITHAFSRAIETGLKVTCVEFGDGKYYDLGTEESLEGYYRDLFRES